MRRTFVETLEFIVIWKCFVIQKFYYIISPLNWRLKFFSTSYSHFSVPVVVLFFLLHFKKLEWVLKFKLWFVIYSESNITEVICTLLVSNIVPLINGLTPAFGLYFLWKNLVAVDGPTLFKDCYNWTIFPKHRNRTGRDLDCYRSEVRGRQKSGVHYRLKNS